ncbi:MAG: hypothetical protein ACC682_16565 [Gemmatimonadota bacterium]
MHTNRRISTVLIVLGTFACGDRGTPVATVQVDTLPGGAIRFTNHSPVWTPATAWRLEEDLRLGTSGDERPVEQFATIAAVLTDRAGAIYVLEGQAQEVRVFRPDGTFSHRIGRRGEGPGELSGAAGLNFGPEGRLWVWGPRLGYSVFESDGTYVTRHVRRVPGAVFPWRGEFGPDGHLYDWGIEFVGLREGNVAEKVRFHPIRVSKDFGTLDSLPALEYATEATGNMAVPFGDGLTLYQDRSGSIWFARYSEYVVYERALDGDTLSIFTLPAEPARVTEAERDSVMEQAARFPPQSRPTREEIRDFKPIMRRIFSDNERYVYVVPELDGVQAGSVVDVFTREGLYLGRMELPQPMVLPLPAPHATGDHLYVVVVDQFDTPYVSRLRIVRPR